MFHFQLIDFRVVHAELLSMPTQQVNFYALTLQQNFPLK